MLQTINIIETGDKLYRIRKKKGLTQAEVAMQLGISSNRLSRWENGQNVPRLEHLVGLAGIYESSLDDLIITMWEPDGSDRDDGV